MRLRPLAPALALLLGTAAACGRESGPAGAGPAPTAAVDVPVDRSSPDATWRGAHAALAAGDLARLRPYLTDTAAVRLARDLEAWRALLSDPATGPRTATRVRLPDDPAERAQAQAALAGGDTAALLRVYVGSDPRAPWAPLPTPGGAGGDRLDVEVPTRDGETRPVRFVRTPDGWRIDRLAL